MKVKCQYPFKWGKTQLFSLGEKIKLLCFLFLIWLLRWANLFTCRLPPFLQTFQPTLFGAHAVHTGAWLTAALPWDLCQTLKFRVDNSSSFCPTRTTPLFLPCAIHLTVHQGSRAEMLTLTGTNKHLEMCSHWWAWSRHHWDAWELGDSRMPGGSGQFTEAVNHQSPGNAISGADICRR